MNETPVEPADLETPEGPNVELAALDPIHEVHVLRELNRRWRRAAIGSIFVAVLLCIVSVVQFAGTFITCRLLKEAREEAAQDREKFEEKFEEKLREVRIAEEKAQQKIALLAYVETVEKHEMIKRSNRVSGFIQSLEESHFRAFIQSQDQRRKLVEQLQADVAEARDNLIAVESMRLLLEKDEEARARIDPRTYADPRQRCPNFPGTGRQPLPAKRP